MSRRAGDTFMSRFPPITGVMLWWGDGVDDIFFFLFRHLSRCAEGDDDDGDDDSSCAYISFAHNDLEVYQYVFQDGLF